MYPRHAKQGLAKAAGTAANDNKNNLQITGGPDVAYVSAHHAVVQWTTNLPASSVLHYGPSADRLDRMERSRFSAKSHRIQLSRLKADTEYHYKVTSSVSGGSVTSQVGTLKTNTRGERPNRYPEQPKS